MTEGTALTIHDRHSEILPSRNDWAVMLDMASAFLKSGLLPSGIKTPEAALLIIQKGKELGVQPTYALSNIAIISGKPVAGSELMLALIYRDHGDSALRIVETTDTICVAQYRRRGWQEASQFSFSMDDAKRAGLLGKDNWKNYPAAMLRARCISAVARLAFPDTIAGLYLPEEMGADIRMDSDGQVRIVEATPVRDEAPAHSASVADKSSGNGVLIDAERETLLHEAQEALIQITKVRDVTGKQLLKTWRQERNGPATTPFEQLKTEHLVSLRDWATEQLQPSPSETVDAEPVEADALSF